MILLNNTVISSNIVIIKQLIFGLSPVYNKKLTHLPPHPKKGQPTTYPYSMHQAFTHTNASTYLAASSTYTSKDAYT